MTWMRPVTVLVGVVLASCVAAASGRASEPESVPSPAISPPLLAAPSLQAEAIGPTMVRVTVAAPPECVVLVEATPEGGASEARRISFGGRASQTAILPVLPGTTYAYRARVENPRASQWSGAVSVRTPPAPTTPPAPPHDLTARALSAFAVELRWQDASDDEYGFAVERRERDGFVLVALLDPGTTSYDHHGRAPDAELVYRVRAFDPAGVSPPSGEATVRTEKLSDAPAVVESFSNRRQAEQGLAPCTTRAVARLDDRGNPVLEQRIEYGDGRAIDLFADAETCGNANCSWVAYGIYEGCYRELGFAGGVGTAVIATTPSGLPVLLGVGHHSARKYGASVSQIVGGRLLDVDEWDSCSIEGADDLTKLSPPFPGCQLDDDLRTAEVARDAN